MKGSMFEMKTNRTVVSGIVTNADPDNEDNTKNS